MNKALNKQIQEEMYSSYLYLAMAAYFESLNLKGFSHWMKAQVQEEILHAMKFYYFIHDKGGKVELQEIKKPDITWDSPYDAFDAAYKHEQYISSCINNLVDLSFTEKDHASYNFLQWYVTEQVEEEASADEIRQQLKMVGDNSSGLFFLDKELTARVYPAAIFDGGVPNA